MADTALNKYACEGFRWAEVDVNEEEHEWLPNPYQAQADAQVLAGAWPGTPLIMCMGQQDDVSSWGPADSASWPMIDGVHCNGGLAWDMEQMLPAEEFPGHGGQGWDMVPAEGAEGGQGWDMVPAEGAEAMPSDYVCWDASAWPCLMEFFPDSKSSTSPGSQSTFAGTEEGDEEDQDTLESAANTSGEEMCPAEGPDNDETSTVCGGAGSDRRGGLGRYSRKLSHQCVPKRLDLGKHYAEDVEKDHITTLMVRNIPNMYTRGMLMEELNSLGFEGEYDFIYLPMDKSTQWNVGYAFVNFSTPAVAKRVIKEMTNYAFQRYDHGSGKVAQISIAHIQGLEKNSAYYSNTAVQCARIQTYRPLVLNSKQGSSTPTASYEAVGSHQPAQRRRRRFRSEHDEVEMRGSHAGSSSKNRARRNWAQDRRYTA